MNPEDTSPHSLRPRAGESLPSQGGPARGEGGEGVSSGGVRTPLSAWRRWLWLPLLALFLFATVMGLRAGQWQEVDSWFNAICSACIGLTFH